MKDSSNNANQIKDSQDSIQMYKLKLDEAEKHEKKFKKLSVTNSLFFVPNCRPRSKGTYPPRCVKSLQLKLNLSYNNPDERGKIEKIKFEFILPSIQLGQINRRELFKNIEIGKDTVINFANNDLNINKFIEGIYSIEVFHDKTSITDAIYRDYLQVK